MPPKHRAARTSPRGGNGEVTQLLQEILAELRRLNANLEKRDMQQQQQQQQLSPAPLEGGGDGDLDLDDSEELEYFE
ncbi:hypothetical protein [Nitrososphaera sp.]|uniref:hypothetical protein n=1 Tax=Nitrososphaera sp. TaxID=1971748 RepID=UPI00307E0650